MTRGSLGWDKVHPTVRRDVVAGLVALSPALSAPGTGLSSAVWSGVVTTVGHGA